MREKAKKAQEGWEDTTAAELETQWPSPREKQPLGRGKTIGLGAGVLRQLALESQETEDAGMRWGIIE